jgi:hypothetical protein
VARGLAVLVAAVVAAVLGYGYWYQATHGYLHVWVHEPRTAASVPDVDLVFLDAGGGQLARVRSLAPAGVIYIVGPAQYACYEIERKAAFSVEARMEWQRCFRNQSRWVSTWARQARTVDLKAGRCQLRGLPVVVRESGGDWWLWWLPLPHAGGKPHRTYSVTLELDSARCAVIERS